MYGQLEDIMKRFHRIFLLSLLFCTLVQQLIILRENRMNKAVVRKRLEALANLTEICRNATHNCSGSQVRQNKCSTTGGLLFGKPSFDTIQLPVLEDLMVNCSGSNDTKHPLKFLGARSCMPKICNVFYLNKKCSGNKTTEGNVTSSEKDPGRDVSNDTALVVAQNVSLNTHVVDSPIVETNSSIVPEEIQVSEKILTPLEEVSRDDSPSRITIPGSFYPCPPRNPFPPCYQRFYGGPYARLFQPKYLIPPSLRNIVPHGPDKRRYDKLATFANRTFEEDPGTLSFKRLPGRDTMTKILENLPPQKDKTKPIEIIVLH